MEESLNNNKRKKKGPQRLKCSVQNYDWGRIGEKSQVACLFSLNSGFDIQRDKPYAEFWMGTHESGPSFVVRSDTNGRLGSDLVSLKTWISENQNVLGDKVVEKWGTDLPFLFKVLSVAKALSIQAHPDKELARALHKSQPSVYKDDSHKPEMALALTELEVLCGFISLEELKVVLFSVPEIVELVGEEVLDVNKKYWEGNVKSILQSVFTKLMSASEDAVSKTVSKLKTRLNMERKVRQLTDKEQLILRLERQYPGDVGVISAFFFNHMTLKPGEALYIAPDEPHAYIYGDCIECMATSDNVVRAGLTPKHRDVQTLCSMLTYRQGFPEIVQGVPLNQYTKRYLPPFDEFEVDCCVLPRGASAIFPAVAGPSLLLVTDGEGTMCVDSFEELITKGDVFFLPAETETRIKSISELQLYRAGVSSRFFKCCELEDSSAI